MTQDQIIWRPEEIVAICKEAGFANGMASIVGLWGLHEFARIVAAKEREECAKVCEDYGRAEEMQAIGNDFAQAIRARGQA